MRLALEVRAPTDKLRTTVPGDAGVRSSPQLTRARIGFPKGSLWIPGFQTDRRGRRPV